jgi:hypothetical protein
LRQRLAARQSDFAGGAAIVIDDEALQDVVAPSNGQNLTTGAVVMIAQTVAELLAIMSG